MDYVCRCTVGGGVFLLRSFLGLFFLDAFHPHSCICLFLHLVLHRHSFLHRFASCYITIVFFSLSSFVIDPLLLWNFPTSISSSTSCVVNHSCSVVLFVLLLFCYHYMFCYYYALLLTTYNSVSWHHDPLLTVELSMDICCVSGKSICT